jgi:hypothetical protein
MKGSVIGFSDQTIPSITLDNEGFSVTKKSSVFVHLYNIIDDIACLFLKTVERFNIGGIFLS